MPPYHLSASFILIAVFSKKIIGISRYCLDMLLFITQTDNPIPFFVGRIIPIALNLFEIKERGSIFFINAYGLIK